MIEKRMPFKVISGFGSMLFCLILAFSQANADMCTITSMPADNELYGTSQKIGVTMATATEAMREVSVVLKWTDKEGNIQTEWLGDGEVAAGSLTAAATINTMADEEIRKAKVPDGKYEVFCMNKFDLLPDTVEEKPCDQQDMIVMYRGEVLPLNSSGLTIDTCAETVGVKTDYGDYLGFTGGYPEKRIDDGECICARYDVEEMQNNKTVISKHYSDCSTAFVRFMKKNKYGEEVVDFPSNQFPNPPIPAFIEDDMQNNAQVINFHDVYSGNCKVFEKPQCPASTYLTIKSLYNEEVYKSPAIFRAILSPILDDTYMYKNNLSIEYKWAIYDLDTKIVIPSFSESYNSDTIEIPDGLIDKNKAYRIEATAHFRRKGCGENYITSINSYFDFSYFCNEVKALKMNETRYDSVPADKNKACYRLSKSEISSGFSVNLFSEKDEGLEWDLDMYYMKGAFYDTSGGGFFQNRAKTVSKSIIFGLPKINSYEVFRGDNSNQDVYVTIERKSIYAGQNELHFSITPRADIEGPIRIVTSNVGVDSPVDIEVLNDGKLINYACNEAMMKMCTNEMLYKYRDFINSINPSPDIVNMQEVISKARCLEAKKNDSNYSCPQSNNSKEYSICCSLDDVDEPDSAADLIFNKDVYDVKCGSLSKENECIAYNKERFEYVNNSLISYYPNSTESGLCSTPGSSILTLQLKEKSTGRVFSVGNAHPEIGVIPTEIPEILGCGFKQESLQSISCRGASIDHLFNNSNTYNAGVPYNSILTGDFNMDVPMNDNLDKYYCPDSKPLAIGLYKYGYNVIENATNKIFHPFTYLDHIFSNFLVKSRSGCVIKKFNLPDGHITFGHDSIICDLDMDE